MKYINPYLNPTAFIVIKESDFDPDRHILPIAAESFSEGELVGLMPDETGEKVYSVFISDEPWMYGGRMGFVKKAVVDGEPVRVYIARPGSSADGQDYFYVRLKAGLYVDRAEIADDFMRIINQKILSHFLLKTEQAQEDTGN